MTWIRLGRHLISLEAIAEIDMSRIGGRKASIHFIGGGSRDIEDRHIASLFEQIGRADLLEELPPSSLAESADVPPEGPAA